MSVFFFQRPFCRIICICLLASLVLLAGCAGIHERGESPQVRVKGQVDTTLSTHR